MNKNNKDVKQKVLPFAVPGETQGQMALEKFKAAKELDKVTTKSVREEEDQNKEWLLEREKENFTNILALKCYNGWLKICDNSAMIVSVWLDGRLGRRYERKDDRGYGKHAKYGVVSIPPDQVGDFILRLAKAKIPLSFDGEWVMEFNLGERVSKEDMVRMLHEDELIIDKVNKLVMPGEVLPGLRNAVKMLLVQIHCEIRDQKDSTKEIALNDMEREVISMNKKIIATARGRMEVEMCFECVGRFVEEMFENVTTMSDLRLITAKQYKKLVDLIMGVENEQAREMKRRAIKRVEKRIESTKKRV